MKLSIVTPSNRVGLSTYAKILDICSFASEDVQVIIRDNSESQEKERFLSNVKQENCKILFGSQCDGAENVANALQEATGEYVFFVADDDSSNKRGIKEIVNCISSHPGDPAIAGITGQYILESDYKWSLFAHLPLNSSSVIDRTKNFLISARVNVIYYSAIKKDLILKANYLMKKLPFFFSFTDQICTIMYLLSGKFESVDKIIYNYDMYEWQDPGRSAKRDILFYVSAGFDASIIRIHWLLCALEGAKTILNPSIVAGISPVERQAVARTWFAIQHAKFSSTVNRIFPIQDSKFDNEAIAIRDKWINISEISFDDLLADICSFMALTSKESSYKYYAYWSSM